MEVEGCYSEKELINNTSVCLHGCSIALKGKGSLSLSPCLHHKDKSAHILPWEKIEGDWSEDNEEEKKQKTAWITSEEPHNPAVIQKEFF